MFFFFFEHIRSSSQTSLRVELLGHRMSVCLDQANPLLKVAVLIYTPTKGILITSVALCPCQHLALSHIYFNADMLQVGMCVSRESRVNTHSKH
jgi:hypothetical protein